MLDTVPKEEENLVRSGKYDNIMKVRKGIVMRGEKEDRNYVVYDLRICACSFF